MFDLKISGVKTMNNPIEHVQIDGFISYKKTRSINEYTARLSIFKNVNNGIKNDCTNEVMYLKGNDLKALQSEVFKQWHLISASFKNDFNLKFCNDRMTSYNYRKNKMIGSIVSYNLISKQ